MSGLSSLTHGKIEMGQLKLHLGFSLILATFSVDWGRSFSFCTDSWGCTHYFDCPFDRVWHCPVTLSPVFLLQQSVGYSRELTVYVSLFVSRFLSYHVVH